MSIVKHAVNITTQKVLLAAAALASLMALVSTTNMCFFWFHQPQMPESVRGMGKFKD